VEEELHQGMLGLMEGSSSYDPVPMEVKGTQCQKVLYEHQLTYHSLILLFHWYSDGPEDSLGLLSLFLLPLEAKVRV